VAVTRSASTISIVTPSYNQAAFLSVLIDNVRSQDSARVQHIVIDGGSTDGTVDLLRSHGEAVTWVSEPDRGQAHAINKGFAMADGDIFGWINCDDRYTPGALAFVSRMFDEVPATSFFYGDALGVDPKGRDYGLRVHVRECGRNDLVDQGDPIVQPAAFWSRELWRSVGDLDESLTYAFDYEYWMRVADRYELVYLPVCLATESLHGEAKTSSGSLGRMREIEAIARRHGGVGVPFGFRPEAAALETLATVSSLARGRLLEARDHAAGALALRPSTWQYAAHVIANAVPGTAAVPRLRLIANRFRGSRAPLYPVDAEAGRREPKGTPSEPGTPVLEA
jgi:glycosyltransferase involved in cell wall biosynthesis